MAGLVLGAMGVTAAPGQAAAGVASARECQSYYGDPLPCRPPSSPGVSFYEADKGVHLFFRAGDTHGSTPTSWEYRLDEGAWVTFTPEPFEDDGYDYDSVRIFGLVPKRSYLIQLRQQSDLGPGAAWSMDYTAATVPDQPVITSVLVGEETTRITFTPGDWQGRWENGYKWRTSDDPDTENYLPTPVAEGPQRIAEVPSPDHGASYRLQIQAMNDIGRGAWSDVWIVTRPL